MSPKLLRILSLTRNSLRAYQRPGQPPTPVQFVHRHAGCIWMRCMLISP